MRWFAMRVAVSMSAVAAVSRRRVAASLAIMLIAVVSLGGCRAGTTGSLKAGALPPRPARINHLAFFKLKEPADAPELIADCDRLLATIPGVVSYHAGTHLEAGRPTVDSNYDVGFYVGFAIEADYARYVDHPNHVKAVNKWRPRWEWIRIHDVVDDTP
ncbi:MAG: Dabb family protein [Phycisphaerales bacterium]|nr:Dabb family protein [Phycisphaerales bacterium]MCI0631669.1 Dabb family protein [Phycisphaerales bacterium]MCI0677033.1 Dabb family protein [Phycisphaerales bacterium]